MTTSNINAAAVLSTLNPESVTALENHYRAAILSNLTATLGAAATLGTSATLVEPVKAEDKVEDKVEVPVKRKPGRPAGSKKEDKKVEDKVEDKASVPAKRPGRPAGSKNKATADLGPSGRAKAEKAATKAASKDTKATAKTAAPTPRAHAKDGRTASQVCRDFDEKYTAKHGEKAPAADVVAHCAKLGLEIATSLVHNVRQNVKKAAAAAAKASKKAAKKVK